MKNKFPLFLLLALTSCTQNSFISSVLSTETQTIFSSFGEVSNDGGEIVFDLTRLGPAWRPFASAYGSPFDILEIYVTLSDKLDKYIIAVVTKNINQSLSEWKLDDLNLDNKKLRALSLRREQITSTLMDLNIKTEYSILDVQIWSPQCCENLTPGITNSSRTAIGARILFQLINKAVKPLSWYVADIFIAPYEMSSWGEPERWYIRDIYPNNDKPLYWRYIYTYDIKPVH
jgi:hypothetical protein